MQPTQQNAYIFPFSPEAKERARMVADAVMQDGLILLPHRTGYMSFYIM